MFTFVVVTLTTWSLIGELSEASFLSSQEKTTRNAANEIDLKIRLLVLTKTQQAQLFFLNIKT